MPELLFDHPTHTYTLDGKRLPSVTQVLEGVGLVDTTWFTEEAKARGNYIHQATALFDKGVATPGLRDDMAGYVAAWAKFREDTGFIPDPDAIEVPCYDKTWWYAGTPDRFGGYSCRPGALIPDIKTGEPLPCHPLQTAAYRLFWRTPLVDRCSVYLRANGKYKVKYHTDVQDWDMFVSALNVYNWKERHSVK